jgi:uncharacterized protein YfaS (alpha-2-macroglobulin family)
MTMGPGAADGQPVVYGQVRLAGGTPVSGAAVTLIDTAGRQAARDRTGPGGGYRVAVPAPGSYTLIVMATGQEPHASGISLSDGPAERDVVLAAAGGLAGTVRAAGSGAPLPGAIVTLVGELGEVAATASADEAGRYRLDAVAAGRYTLAVSAPSSEPAAIPVVIAAGAAGIQDAELSRYARLTGTARTAAGAPIPDARVVLLDADGKTVATAITGDDGSYAFDDLPGGDYTVIASGYPPAASKLTVTSSEAQHHEIQLGYPEA